MLNKTPVTTFFQHISSLVRFSETFNILVKSCILSFERTWMYLSLIFDNIYISSNIKQTVQMFEMLKLEFFDPILLKCRKESWKKILKRLTEICFLLLSNLLTWTKTYSFWFQSQIVPNCTLRKVIQFGSPSSTCQYITLL